MLFPVLVLCLASSCSTEPEQSLTPAYVAPASANLRSQLSQKNSAVAVLKHGDRVGIVDVRRRYVKVRTAKGVEGWVDAVDLLSADEMARIKRERAEAMTLPSEGTATAYELLNVHLEPSRRSPAFAQIPEGGAVSVLARRILPRATGPLPAIPFERPKPPARKPRKDRSAKNAKQPPKPAAPRPPDNWEHPWGSAEVETPESTQTPVLEKGKKSKSGKPEKPVVLESWTLVRTKLNETGWVLTRNLMMSIPDDVAQYAGGRHITSYFDLGPVHDEEQGVKHNWLWTTAGDTETADFDAWRVFLWNRRRHRYETSYRQRDVEGYFPVTVAPAPEHTANRNFQLITKDEDGKLRRRSYVFDGTLVHLTGTEDYDRTAGKIVHKPDIDGKGLTPKKLQESWLRHKWTALRQAISGKR